MKLTLEGIKEKEAWERSGIALPAFDPALLAERTKKNPVWVHFGIGNIFRIFLGGIADKLIANGSMDHGITCVESFDYDVVDRIYMPYDNLALAVTLHSDGRKDMQVIGSLTEAVKAQPGDAAAWRRLKEIFQNPGLQLASFTITEKGYALRGANGETLGYVQADMENGPDKAVGAMGVIAAMLYERFQTGKTPLALVSMDNVSQNGEKLRQSVLEMARAWREKGFVEEAFIDWAEDEKNVSFPWTMIDKITPRPSEDVKKTLEELGVEDMDITVTSKHTYIAPFVNAEAPQYLVIEDAFPNGRPPLESAGVYMADRETVNRSERMKVTVCLNPIHTALCTYDCLLGYTLFADGMADPELKELARRVGYTDGLPMVQSPRILSPEAFLDEVINVRFPNPYLGDTAARIAVDISQQLGIRFGVTVKAYVSRYGDAKRLTGIPLAIAGWIRYLLAVDDNGAPFALSPDPMLPELKEQLAGVEFGNPDSLRDQLRPILSNANIFGLDLYEAGIGQTVEDLVRSQLVGPGAVRKTLREVLKMN